ncbi:MAG: FUSC family protein [Synechococcaceae cyanobacterium]|nr:FUSC family protein [Synechococcaceae cyanobacterium]
MRAAAGLGLRRLLSIGLACGLTWTLGHTFELGSATAYGVVIAAVMIRPAFDHWPKPVYVLLPLLMVVGLGLGTLLKPLLEGPAYWQFAVVTAIAQCLGQALPDRLMMVRNLLAVVAVLPLLSSNATWLAAWQQTLAVLIGLAVATLIQAALRLPGEADADKDAREQAEQEKPIALPPRNLAARFCDPFFWRKLVVAMLAFSIGLGLGATNPKYLYFGVVLLLSDDVGSTVARVRDRMMGVSLGVLMPWLVFNTQPINSVSVALVMAGTTALLSACGLLPYLRTALISSGVTFVGYGALTDWYVPTRWLDYLLGCALALAVCLLVHPVSALRRFRELAGQADRLTEELKALLPSALEEARALGQEKSIRDQLQRWQLAAEGGR